MKNLIILFTLIALISCNKPSSKENDENQSEFSEYLKKEDFQKEVDGKQTDLFVLENQNGIKVYLTNYGARIVGILTPDRDGNMTDISPGYRTIDEYLKDNMFLGATVGRYANRIRGGKFSINGVEYTLALNDNTNSLHGGIKGFDKRVWDAAQNVNSVEFSYLSKDGEEGYPGNLNVNVTYILTDEDELKIAYEATTDQTTILNLTNHNFWNLKGEGEGTILDHFLQINADYITPVDETLIPTGVLLAVQNTPFDFREGKMIGQDINGEHPQLLYGLGYDHNWVLNQEAPGELTFAAKLWEPTNGRYVEISTTEPGLQVYTGNFMNGTVSGKAGKTYEHRSAIAMESQHFPDSPNEPDFPSTFLMPDSTYTQLTVWKFGVMPEEQQ